MFYWCRIGFPRPAGPPCHPAPSLPPLSHPPHLVPEATLLQASQLLLEGVKAGLPGKGTGRAMVRIRTAAYCIINHLPLPPGSPPPSTPLPMYPLIRNTFHMNSHAPARSHLFPHLHAAALLLQQRHDHGHVIEVPLLQQLLQEVTQLPHAEVAALSLVQPAGR